MGDNTRIIGSRVAHSIVMKKLIAVVVLLVLAAILSPVLFVLFDDEAPPPVEGLPWQVERLPEGGSRVFGLELGVSTLAEARQRFGPDMQLAIVAAPGQPGSLEAFYDAFRAGFVTGKIILTANADGDVIAGMRERAAKSEYMESTTRRFTLAPDDAEQAQAIPIRAITFIPSLNLDEEMIVQRFGPPAERIRSAEHMEHFLYPELGLDLALDAKAKEVLQYVAPRDFARLRAPLTGEGR